MADIRIDTDAVVTVAGNIKLYKTQIRENFSNVQSAVTQLDNCWEGSAATSAIRKFNEIKSKYPEVRYNVLDNYVNFLLQQVGEGYTQTENTNVSLADLFK